MNLDDKAFNSKIYLSDSHLLYTILYAERPNKVYTKSTNKKSKQVRSPSRINLHIAEQTDK